MGFTGQLGTSQSQPGNIEPGTAGTAGIELSTDFVLDLAAFANIGHFTLRANFVLDLALLASAIQNQSLAADFALDVTNAPGLSLGQILAAGFVMDLANAPGLSQGQPLAADFVLDLALDEVYTGPGSGLVIGGVTQAQQIAMLEEGDLFRVTLAWAGVRGRTGLARVLSRSLDSSERVTFVLQFIASASPSAMPSQVVRYTVDTRTNLVRRVRNTESQVNQLES